MLVDSDFLLDQVQVLSRFIYGVLTPAPTSPLFQEGGLLEGYNEDLVQIFGSMMVFALLDLLIVKHLILPKARYFALHVLCNAWVCYLAFPAVIRTFTEDPLTVFRGPGMITPNNIIAALHLYHCIGFNLNADDIFHHLIFCFTLCSMAIPAKQVSGTSIPYAGFFLSGLPGGIDYLMLTLSAHGYVSKDTQKNVYTKLNVYIRGPAMSIYIFAWWATRITGEHPIPMIVTIVSCLLHYYNGQYYTQQAIESNALYTFKLLLDKKGVVLPEVKLNDLHKSTKKKAANQPSSGSDSGDSSVMSPSSGAHVPLPRQEADSALLERPRTNC